METFENEIIFSQQFPDAQPVSLLDMTELLIQGTHAGDAIPDHTFEEMVEQVGEKYTYEPRPDAAERSEEFIALAIAVCKDFEIDTEISKRNHEIAVTMDIDCSWYGGPIKHSFEALLKFADDFTLACDKSTPDRIRITMAYRTHDIYAHGKKVIW